MRNRDGNTSIAAIIRTAFEARQSHAAALRERATLLPRRLCARLDDILGRWLERDHAEMARLIGELKTLNARDALAGGPAAPMRDATERVVALFGGADALARLLAHGDAAIVAGWVESGRIPSGEIPEVIAASARGGFWLSHADFFIVPEDADGRSMMSALIGTLDRLIERDRRAMEELRRELREADNATVDHAAIRGALEQDADR
jgi:hypothetical protein